MSMNGGNMYPAKEGKPEIYYSVKAQRGGELRCKGWKQETILRMLENNMENAEIPEQLVIFEGTTYFSTLLQPFKVRTHRAADQDILLKVHVKLILGKELLQ